MEQVKYKRILLKLSGEVLAGTDKFGLNSQVMEKIVGQIKEVVNMGVEVALVVGAGNFWRGRYGKEMNRATADYMGILATALNALALQDALESSGVETRVQTAIEMREIAEPFILKRALKHLESGKVVIFACGTGHPYFTTDTGAVLRAIEINADVLLLGKSIDAVYSDDPLINKDAIKYDHITFTEVLNQDLKVMDSTATAMCRDNNLPIHVFGTREAENIVKAVKGEKIGTIVDNR